MGTESFSDMSARVLQKKKKKKKKKSTYIALALPGWRENFLDLGATPSPAQNIDNHIFWIVSSQLSRPNALTKKWAYTKISLSCSNRGRMSVFARTYNRQVTARASRLRSGCL